MKMNCWLLAGALFAGNLVGQQLSNAPSAAPLPPPPALPAPAVAPPPAPSEPATKAPAQTTETHKKRAKKNAAIAAPKPGAKVVRPSAAVTRCEPLTPGPATVAANNVNVRGQARLQGEVIARLTRGDSVTVLEEIVLGDSGPDEPSAWAKISLPSGHPVWISALFINPDNNTTKTRVNLRGGPGENYSILGRLERGENYKPLDRKGDWIKIEAPAGAYGFVASQYLRSEPPAPKLVAAPKPSGGASAAVVSGVAASAPAPSVIAETPAMAPAPVDKPAAALAEPAAPVPPAPVRTPEIVIENLTPAALVRNEAAGRHNVQREGIVRDTLSAQAPGYLALVSPNTKKLIEYLVSSNPEELDLRRFKGMRVIVSGEESLEKRWGNIPVLTVDHIEVVE